MKEKTTDGIRDALQQYTELRDGIASVMQPRWVWQHRIPVDEQIIFLRTVWQYHAVLEREVLREYPQFLGWAFMVNSSYVFDRDSVEPPTTNAIDPVGGTGTDA